MSCAQLAIHRSIPGDASAGADPSESPAINGPTSHPTYEPILISHNLNDVFAVADRLAVLYLGRLVASGPVSDFNVTRVVDYMTTGYCTRPLATVPSVAATADVMTPRVADNNHLDARRVKL